MDSAHGIAGAVKRVNKKSIKIFGGNHIASTIWDYQRESFNPNRKGREVSGIQDLEDENIDLAMFGEVDLEFPRLVDALHNDSSINDIKGLVRRLPGSTLFKANPPRPHS